MLSNNMPEEKTFRAGFAALVGRPNVGKSTLLNALVGEKVSIVTSRPQTTRHRVLGVLNRPGVQLAFVVFPRRVRREMDVPAEVGEARETLIAITLPEKPGSFQKFCSVIGRRTVTEFNYRLSGRQQAHIFVGFATQSRQDGSALISQLVSAGYETVDLTDNELAKLHVRHMVGGHAPEVHHERLCRFEFPERPGALAQFLEKLGGRWNISLFHYRNHGADYGRVLAGFEVTENDLPAFRAFLDELAYPYTPEYENPAYKFFLG